jgi:6-methylsalicylate decarboxylase
MHVSGSRRAHLRSLAAGAAAFTVARPALARATPRRLRIDAHAHALPPRYRAALADAGVRAPGGLPFPAWSEAAALSFMRRYGIRAQVVSISDPGVEFLPVDASVALAQALNDDLADLVRRRPDRFAALAVLPVRDVESSVREVGRALDELQLDGIGLLSNYDGDYLGSPRFRPLLAELDRRAAYVFVHPTAPALDDSPRGGLPAPIVEFPFETTRTVRSLLQSGALRDFPRIRWQLAHAGGLVPALVERLARDLPPGATDPLGLMRYDTALSAGVPAMAAVRTIVPDDRILFATDWPFTTALFLLFGEPQPELARTFAGEQLADVLAANALAVFPRLAAAIEASDG